MGRKKKTQEQEIINLSDNSYNLRYPKNVEAKDKKKRVFKTNENNAFFDQYKDPRWQKKRLEILERDDWECQECGDKGSKLNVHHRFYEKNVKAWEYEDDFMITLCNSCHEEIHYWLMGAKIVTGFMTIEKLEYAYKILLKLRHNEIDLSIKTLKYISKTLNKK